MSARQAFISSPMPITKAHYLSSIYWLEEESFERRQVPQLLLETPESLVPTTPWCLSLSDAWVALLFCLIPRLLLAPSTNTCKIQYPLQRTSSTKWKKGKSWKKLGCAGEVEQAVKNHTHFHSQPLKTKARRWCFPPGLMLSPRDCVAETELMRHLILSGSCRTTTWSQNLDQVSISCCCVFI